MSSKRPKASQDANAVSLLLFARVELPIVPHRWRRDVDASGKGALAVSRLEVRKMILEGRK